MSRPMTRRRFLVASLVSTAGAVLAACGPAPTPTTVPPTAKPAATGAPTQAAPAATATMPAPTATVPAPTATAAPTKPGKNLIGKLEGPKVITDAAKMPKTFKEAPALADLVKAGKLPPIAERLPEEPLVIQPVHEIGKYGGTLRRGFTGPADQQGGQRVCGGDRLIFYDSVGFPGRAPNLGKSWKVSDDGKSLTVYLRKGVKWSDGHPFTAEDIIFWFEDIYLNKEFTPVPSLEFSINGKYGQAVKIDDYTVEFRFPEPYPSFVDFMGASMATGQGHAHGSMRGNGTFAPAHYVKQFHPKYASKEDLDAKMKAAKVDTWVKLYIMKVDWCTNPECPCLTPWKMVTGANTTSWTFERNPYYWAVDTDGNQLPYIDKVVFTLAENADVLNLRAIAGDFDVQERHLKLTNLPVMLENQARNNYTVSLHPADNGSDACIHLCMGLKTATEMAKWLATADFRRAISLGINRDQINETVFMGIGTPGSPVVTERSPYSPGPEYRTLWHTYDPQKANAMLDQLGLTKKDAEGYRLRLDGQGRVAVELNYQTGGWVDYAAISQMIKTHWKTIGIWADINESDATLLTKRIDAFEAMTRMWMNDGTDEFYTYAGNVVPFAGSKIHCGVYYDWIVSNKAKGTEWKDPAVLQGWELFQKAPQATVEERYKIGQEIWKIAVDQVWTIGIVGQAGAFMGLRVAKNNVGNIPTRQLNVQAGQSPLITLPATWYFKS